MLALSKFRANYYDIVLLDIKMPYIDGFDLYNKIKEMDNNIRICFLTASEAYYQQFREKGYSQISRDLFIQKPIELEELLKRIENVLK